jgi:hypothetical protein
MASGTATTLEFVWGSKEEPENTEIAETKIECHALIGKSKHLAFAAIRIKCFPSLLDA